VGRYLLFLFPALLLILALLSEEPQKLLSGLSAIWLHPGVLVTDYFEVGGIPATLLNVALVGFVGGVLLLLVPALRGDHIASWCTLMAFAFFGKNPLNILPILFGCFLFTRFARKDFREFLPASLFATSLAPVVGLLVWGWRLRFELAVVSGILSGFLTLAIAPRAASFHSGYNLYNIGFSGGIVGILLCALFEGFGLKVESAFLWKEHAPPCVPLVLILLFSCFVFAGFLMDPRVFRQWKIILASSGKDIVDFFSLSPSATLCNMGVTGILGVFYVLLVEGSFNGPVLGGIFTMVGFAAFGKHPRNVFPVIFGVYLGTLCAPFRACEPGPLLAALFSSALAPLAGAFGIFAGVLAGFLHLFVAMSIGALHGGINLYNNGFAAGFVAAIVLSVFSWRGFLLTKVREERLTD